jgi:hypothetical protein
VGTVAPVIKVMMMMMMMMMTTTNNLILSKLVTMPRRTLAMDASLLAMGRLEVNTRGKWRRNTEMLGADYHHHYRAEKENRAKTLLEYWTYTC